jgi:hypothetical protein
MQGNADMELAPETLASDITAEVRPYATDASFIRSHLGLTDNAGLSLSCDLLEPHEPGTRRPGIVVMEGRDTLAIDHAADMKNVVVVRLEYPYEPKPGTTLQSFFLELPEMREAALAFVPLARLALEYLRVRPDVDPTRLILLGYGYAAPLVPRIAAEDKGLALAGMIYGGGGLRSLIAHNVRRSKGWLTSQVLGLLGSLVLGPLDPIHHAEEVAPTRLLMVNGRLDEWIPRKNAEAFYRRARSPKKIIWVDSAHFSSRNRELSRRIAGIVRDELVSLQLLNGTHMA